jgi:riboflavin kinase/FMN adenylyltransferase
MVAKLKIYNNFNIPKKLKSSILLVGNFDGLHVGHQKLFNLAKKFKKKFKSKIGVITFEPMPKMYFNKSLKNFRISNVQQKKEIIKKFGTDFLIIKKFDKKFSKIKSENFIKKILYKKLNTKFLFVSNNFKFGNKREGDTKQLMYYEKKYDYKLIKPKPFKLKKNIVSSTLIRKLLSKGKITTVNKLLNRNWSIENKVKKGRQLGKKIGFPTCNLDVGSYVVAKPGVYAVKIYQRNKKKTLKGIANLGYRPTFNQKKLLLEVHIFNFHGNLYNKYLTIEFIDFIRKEKKFKNVNQLKKQIELDLNNVRKKLK